MWPNFWHTKHLGPRSLSHVTRSFDFFSVVFSSLALCSSWTGSKGGLGSIDSFPACIHGTSWVGTLPWAYRQSRWKPAPPHHVQWPDSSPLSTTWLGEEHAHSARSAFSVSLCACRSSRSSCASCRASSRSARQISLSSSACFLASLASSRQISSSFFFGLPQPPHGCWSSEPSGSSPGRVESVQLKTPSQARRLGGWDWEPLSSEGALGSVGRGSDRRFLLAMSVLKCRSHFMMLEGSLICECTPTLWNTYATIYISVLS